MALLTTRAGGADAKRSLAMQVRNIVLAVVLVAIAFFASALQLRRLMKQDALKHAVISGDEIRVAEILRSRPAYATKYRARHGITLLHLAAGNGHSNLVALLLKHGADIDARAKPGLTPLIQAVNYGKLECARVLIAHGAKVDLRGPLERTALFYATTQPAIAEFLLQSGADPNAQDFFGQSPLHRACEGGNLDVVKLLIAAGADPRLADNGGETPVTVAERQKHSEVAQYIRSRFRGD